MERNIFPHIVHAWPGRSAAIFMQPYRSSASEPTSTSRFSVISEAVRKIQTITGRIFPWKARKLPQNCHWHQTVVCNQPRRHKTQINLCGCFIRFLIQPVQQCTYHLTVKVDRCYPSDITAIYRLITIGIETLSSATIRNQLFTASQIIHRPECSGNRLTQCIQTDLWINIQVHTVFCRTYGRIQFLFLFQQE